MLCILIVRLTSLGDIIHSFHAVHDIYVNVKNVQIDWLVDTNFKDVPRLHDNIHNVFSVPIRKLKKEFKILHVKDTLRTILEIRKNRYDYIIDTHGMLKSSVLAFLCRGKRYGYCYTSTKEKIASLLYSKRISVNMNQQAIYRARELCSKIFEYSISNEYIDSGIKEEFLHNNKGTDKYLFIAHGTSRETKLLDMKYWILFIEHWVKLGNRIKVTYYGETERNRVYDIKCLIPDYVDVIEQTDSIFEIATYIKNASLVISVDTGFGHLSSAIGTPTIGIYMTSNPNLFGMIGNKGSFTKNILVTSVH